MKASHIRRFLALIFPTAALVTLVACGGGGNSSSGTSFSGTAARGAALAGATINITCANGVSFTTTTNSQGAFSTSAQSVSYPCTGVAALGSLSLRSIVFSGATVNFTPLTDLLVTTVLATAQTGGMTLDQFKAKVAADATFAASVSKPERVAPHRAVVVAVVRQLIIDSNKTAAAADAILVPVATASFESTPFTIGSPLDTVLDLIASVIQNPDGSVKASASVGAVKASASLPPPQSTPTGA
jgi:hypothetical protein